MADTFTLLTRGVSVDRVNSAVVAAGHLPVTVTIHADPGYVDDLGLPLASYDLAVTLVGQPVDEYESGKKIQAQLPEADSLLLKNMQVVV